MTPDERALRDAFLSELWRPCPEVRRGSGLREWVSTAARSGYASCHSCGVVFRQPSGAEEPWRFCTECAQDSQ